MRPARHERERRKHNRQELDKSQSHRLGTPEFVNDFGFRLVAQM